MMKNKKTKAIEGEEVSHIDTTEEEKIVSVRVKSGLRVDFIKFDGVRIGKKDFVRISKTIFENKRLSRLLEVAE